MRSSSTIPRFTPDDATSLMLNARATPRLPCPLPHLRHSTSHALHDSARLRPLPSQPQPTVSSEDGHTTLRARKHGNTSLPLPPILDPVVIAAKEKYTAAKAAPADESEQTDFQKQLASNAFAHALATPIRQCHLTRARLPSHFLLPFSASVSEEPLSPSNKKSPPRPITVSLLPVPKSKLPRYTTLPTSTYALNRRDVLEHLNKKRGWGRIVDQRMQDAYARRIGRKDAKNLDVGREWHWDAGMPDVVLKQLRREVVEKIGQCLEGGDGYLGEGLVPLVGCGEEDLAGVLVRCALSEEERQGFGNVPVHVSEDMLGPEEGKAVFERLDFGEHKAWAILKVVGERSTMPLQLALHQLAMYVSLEAKEPSKHSASM